MSKLDLAAEKLKMFRSLKGGYPYDFSDLRKLREKFSGTGKGHTYETFGESPIQWIGGRTSRLSLARMDM
eukprot:15151257-Alexandrium_andersonii.AAC.1